MLHFCNTNIYLASELSNDIADEVWTTNYPACVNDSDAQGIYEGVKLHKFDFNELLNNTHFFDNKSNVALTIPKLNYFIFRWLDNCISRKTISNVVDVATWVSCYHACYKKVLVNTDAFEGALGYYESLMLYDFHQYLYLPVSYKPYHSKSGIDKMNLIPEISWMLADYLHNGRKSVWANYLTEYIRGNVRSILYKIGMMKRACDSMVNLTINLHPKITIDDVNFTNPQSVYYFDNPFDNDFHTNYMYINQLISTVVDK